jgi:hypothetical protein
MFKLSELFVSITADDGPIKKTLAGLKTGLVASSAAVVAPFKAIGGAISAALGPIGLIATAITGLVALMDQNNIYVRQLGAYFQVAMGLITGAVRPVIAYITELITRFVEWGLQSKTVGSTISTAIKYVSAGFENVKIAIDVGIEAFGALFASGQETFMGIAEVAGNILGPALETVGKFIRNWPDYFAIAYIKIKEKIINIGELIMQIPEAAKVAGEYFANNWVKLFTDAGNAIIAIFTNIGKNIKDLFQAVMDWWKDPTKGFNWQPTSLLKGFEATADALPALFQGPLTKLDSEVQAHLDKIDAHEKKFQRGQLKHAEMTKQRVGAESQIMGVAEARSRIIQNIFSGKGDLSKQQLQEATLARKNLDIIAKRVDSLGVARAAAP